MARKVFTSYAPTELNEIEVNGTVFNVKASVPGDVLLDFLANSNADDTSAMAGTLRNLLDEAIVPEQLDAWHAFIRDPANGVSLNLLAEIAGYVAEVLSGAGNDSAPQPVSPLHG